MFVQELKPLTLDGDGSSSMLTGDYSSTARYAYFQPSAGQIWEVYQLRILIVCSGTIAPILYGDYAGMSNGVTVAVFNEDNDVSFPLSGGIGITSNAFYELLGFETTQRTGASGNSLSGGLAFEKPIVVDSGKRIGIKLNDDFSSLGVHTFGLIAKRIQ